MTQDLASRVHDLLDQNRVLLRGHLAMVAGRHGWYRVRATDDGCYCECQAAESGSQCSHVLAAMAKWWEAARPQADGLQNPTADPSHRREVSTL